MRRRWRQVREEGGAQRETAGTRIDRRAIDGHGIPRGHFDATESLPAIAASADRADSRALAPEFHTSDWCVACHNGLTTPSGQDVSIGFDWRACIMANSARDPYWPASVRRESIDHPESTTVIEDECASCHMPMARYHAKVRGQRGEAFSHLARTANSRIQQ